MVTATDPPTGERGPQRTPAEGVPSLLPEGGGEASSAGDAANGVGGILPLHVRGVRLRDLLGIRRLTAFHRFNQPDSLLGAATLPRFGLGASLPLGRSGRPAFVACAGQRLVGFAQFQTAAPDQRWRLLAMGASVGVFDADPVWDALLTHAVRDAGLRGAKRLFARIPSDLPMVAAMRRSGWSPYSVETVYAASSVERRRRPTSVRAQTQADTWAIHQVYNAAVPRPVQTAEAYTSHRWDLRAPRPGNPGQVASGWVLEDGHEMVGYARAMSRAGTHVLELVFLPGRSDILDDLLSGVLAALPNPPARRVLCAVRAYQTEVATALEERGFDAVLEQELLVRYTTANVRIQTADAVPFHVEVREALPQRVPSFLHGRPGDGSAD